MGLFDIKLPDVGEGIAEAELTEWHVKLGDVVQEDDVLAVVMTDKAAIEIPSSVAGTVAALGGEIGDMIAIGAVLLRIETDGAGNQTDAADDVAVSPDPSELADETVVDVTPDTPKKVPSTPRKPVERAQGTKPLAAPSVRARARDAGVDLRHISGTGPAGRISHQDVDDWINTGGSQNSTPTRGRKTDVQDVRVVGMRRKIAEKMQQSKRQIPHITIVEEVEMQALEDLRKVLNKKHEATRQKLTLLPFMMRAIVEAVAEQPNMNARYDDEAGVVQMFGAVNIGIATQTPNGLSVPVIHHAEAANLWDNATELVRLSGAAREGTITRDEMSDGTITITSLGPLGGLATTPIINYPEVAIVGINKMQIRPVWDGQKFQPRKMMNISCSFDHRVIDGWDAAIFVQKIKSLLENPAMLFVEG